MPTDPPQGPWRVAVLGPTTLFDASGREHVDIARQDLKVLTSLVAFASGQDLVEVEVIEEAAWGTNNPSPRALRSSLYRLRGTLGADAIVTRRGAVGLAAVVQRDIDDFLSHAGAGDACAALSLVRGRPFDLMGEGEPWQTVRRQWAQRIEALRDRRTHELMEEGSWGQAIDILSEQLTHTPHAGFRWVRLVDALSSMGRRVDALRAVENARRAMSGGGVPLDAALLEREQALLSGGTVPGPPRTPSPSHEVSAAAQPIEPVQGHAAPPPREPPVVGDVNTSAQRFWKRSAQVPGRQAELQDIVTAVTAGLDPVVAVVGQAGMGTLRVMRAAVGVLAQRGWRIIVPGNGADLTGAWDLAAEGSDGGRQRVVAVDLAHHDPVQLRRLAQQAVSPGSRRVLLRCAVSAGDRRLPDRLDEILGTAVQVVRVGPMGAAALTEVAPAAASLIGAERLQVITGGLPALAKSAASLAAAGVHPGVIEVTLTGERLATLGSTVSRLVCGLALQGGRSRRAALGDMLQVDQTTVHAVAHELGELGWLTELTAETMSIDASLAPLVVAATDPAIVTDLADRLRSGLGTSAGELKARVHVARMTGLQGTWDDAIRTALTMSSAEMEAVPDDVIESIELILEAPGVLDRCDPQVTLLTSRLGVAMRIRGDIAAGWRLAGEAFRRSLSESTASAFQVTRDSVYPAVVTATDDGEPSRALIRTLLRRPDLAPAERLEARALAVYHELVRGDHGVGLAAAMEVLGEAEAHGDPDLLGAVCGHVTPDLGFERGARRAAETAYQHELWRGNLAVATRALVYMICARLRRGEGDFQDPLIAELAILVDQDSVRSAEIRSAGINRAAHMLRIPTERPFLVDPQLPTYETPLRVAARRVVGCLLSTPAWTTLAPTALVGDPAVWRGTADVDVLLWKAAQASEAGDRVSASTALHRALVGPDGADRDLTTARQSPLVVTRLPVACQVLQRTGDRDLAARVLGAHLGRRGEDLSMLPVVHLGPVNSWLAAAADLAGDPLAAELHADATARLTALKAHVMETA